jgi:hypothetical protein
LRLAGVLFDAQNLPCIQLSYGREFHQTFLILSAKALAGALYRRGFSLGILRALLDRVAA